MLKYNIIVWIIDSAQIIMPVEYENEYNLKKDIVSLGINGVMQKNENSYVYFPPNRITRIDVEEIKI